MPYYKHDVTGGVALCGGSPGEGWTELTQEETNAELFNQAKIVKLDILRLAKEAFMALGFSYEGKTFTIDFMSIAHIVLKGSCDESATDHFKFADIDGVFYDFVNVQNWFVFQKAITSEADRIQRYYIAKKTEINALTYPEDEIADIEAVTINFGV